MSSTGLNPEGCIETSVGFFDDHEYEVKPSVY
jgi:hypothetical protein